MYRRQVEPAGLLSLTVVSSGANPKLVSVEAFEPLHSGLLKVLPSSVPKPKKYAACEYDFDGRVEDVEHVPDARVGRRRVDELDVGLLRPDPAVFSWVEAPEPVTGSGR